MIGRFISWITNEVIVKNLANNRNFQKFAVRIDSTIQKNKKTLQDFSKENLSMVKDRLGKSGGGPVAFAKTLVSDVREEIAKEMKKSATKK
jgi:hypothetical protein